MEVKPTPPPWLGKFSYRPYERVSCSLPCAAPTFRLTRRYLVYLGPNLGPLLCVCVCLSSSSSYYPLRRRRRPSLSSASTISTVLGSYKDSLGSRSDFSSLHNRLLFGFWSDEFDCKSCCCACGCFPSTPSQVSSRCFSAIFLFFSLLVAFPLSQHFPFDVAWTVCGPVHYRCCSATVKGKMTVVKSEWFFLSCLLCFTTLSTAYLQPANLSLLYTSTRSPFILCNLTSLSVDPHFFFLVLRCNSTPERFRVQRYSQVDCDSCSGCFLPLVRDCCHQQSPKCV